MDFLSGDEPPTHIYTYPQSNYCTIFLLKTTQIWRNHACNLAAHNSLYLLSACRFVGCWYNPRHNQSNEPRLKAISWFITITLYLLLPSAASPRPRHSPGFNNKISNKTRGQMEGEYPHRGSRASARIRWENIYSLPDIMPLSCTLTLALPMAEVLAQLLSQNLRRVVCCRCCWLQGKCFWKHNAWGSLLPTLL